MKAVIDFYDVHLKHWWTRPSYLVVIVFIAVLGFFHGKGQAQIAGFFLGIAAIVKYRKCIKHGCFRILPEVKLYWAWAVWSILIGLVIAVDYEFFFHNVKILIQMCVMLWALNVLLSEQRQDNSIYYAVFTIALINVLAVVLGIDYRIDNGEYVLQDDVEFGQKRVGGVYGNANGFGIMLVSGIWAFLMWYKRMSAVKLIVIVAGIGVLGYFCLQTGSRKVFIVGSCLVASWIVWALPNRKGTGVLWMGVSIAILMISAPFLLGYVMDNTIVGERFQRMIDFGGGSAVTGFREGNIRHVLIVDGFMMWLHHPIFGVGLGQFGAHHWSGLYSHSDYIEPLACTGLLGFILYQGFAFVVTKRLIGLLRVRLPDEVRRKVKGMLLFMLWCHYLLGFGTPMWSSQLHVLLVMFCGVCGSRIKSEYVLHRYPTGV